MQTFGIDESVPDEYLLSSRLAAFQGQQQHDKLDTHMIPVSYVSGYTSDGFMTIPEKKLAPGYLSIEGAELLQQSWVVNHTEHFATIFIDLTWPKVQKKCPFMKKQSIRPQLLLIPITTTITVYFALHNKHTISWSKLTKSPFRYVCK